MKLDEGLRAVDSGRELDRAEAREVFAAALHADTDPALLGAFLLALAQRGESAAEIAGAADALRAGMVPFEHDAADAIDTCGTGGDGLGLFNLSTAAAVVAAAAGARVIKHGNRSVSSRCGSADLLAAAGLRLELTPGQASRVFEEEGIVFLFAPAWHPAMRFAAPVRKALGVRTIFNFLGPLCNPGRVRRQLLGVSEAQRVDDFAAVLAALGHEQALVVHGAGGADELTLAGPNRVAAVGAAPRASFDAAGLGLAPAPVVALAGGDAAQNLQLLETVFAGESGPLADAVALNAAAALLVAGRAATPGEGLAQARAALASGAADTKLASWAETTRKVAEAAPA